MRLWLVAFALLQCSGHHGARRWWAPHHRRPRRATLTHLCAEADVSSSVTSSAVKYSGSSGAALEISNVCLSIGNNDVMTNVHWSILPKERWALVGPNGVGKSTLLKAITQTGGEMVSIREGEVLIAKKARMGYLEQKGVSGSTRTVRAEVSSRMDRLSAATAALERAEKTVADGDTSDDALSALEAATLEFETAGGLTVEQKISNVLNGLGFIEEDWDRPCAEFSGGWQMRIALARLLLSEPDLLLLDEPTNHLDKGARAWLADYLSRYDGTLLVVSHDVPLLNTAVNSIAEVRGGTIELYKSRSHAQWEVEREERVRQAQAAYEANQRELARMQTFVDRFGAKTMGASLAQSKLKAIEKLEGQMPDGDVAAKMQAAPKAVLRLPAPPRGSQRLLELKGCTLAWPSSSAVSGGDASSPPSILSDVSITINRGSRIVVRGPNGAGKSTLLSALSGKLKPRAGERVEGDGLELGVFTQDLAQDLDQDDLAVNVVTKKVRERDATISDERARAALGALGLTGEKSVRKVGFLSGGEKARVALASFVLMRHNLLLLDEPSNHLDVNTLKVRRFWLLFIMEERASPPDLPPLGPACSSTLLVGADGGAAQVRGNDGGHLARPRVPRGAGAHARDHGARRQGRHAGASRHAMNGSPRPNGATVG